MKLAKSLAIVAVLYVGVYVGMWGFLEFNNANNSVVALTLYSAYEFDEVINEMGSEENLHIVKLDEDTIYEYPVLLELAQQNLSRDIPVTADGETTATYEQVKGEVEYIVSRFVDQYDGSIPSDFYRDVKKDNGWHSVTLKEPYFYHDDILYMFEPDIIVIDAGESQIGMQKIRTDYNSLQDSLAVSLTDMDFDSLPRFKEAFEQIGKYEQNVQSRKKMNESEFREYEQWAIGAGLADERIVFDYGFIKYQDRYHHLYLRA